MFSVISQVPVPWDYILTICKTYKHLTTIDYPQSINFSFIWPKAPPTINIINNSDSKGTCMDGYQIACSSRIRNLRTLMKFKSSDAFFGLLFGY